ncbi:MAG: nucleotidyltransferase domain-containing protein [bacterium]
MNQTEALEIAEKYLMFIKANKFNYEKAYLFGSYARGTFTEDSDIDIAIVIKNLKERFNSQVNLLKLTYNIDTRIEPFPLDFAVFDNNDSLSREILKYGIEIK